MTNRGSRPEASDTSGGGPAPAGVDPRRRIPRTDVLLADPRLRAARDRLGELRVKDAVRAAQQLVRARAVECGDPDGSATRADAAADGSWTADIVALALASLPSTAGGLQPVINATGVLLHTNLGRAALSAAAVDAITAAAGFVDVEYDTATGARGRRGAAVLDMLLRLVPSAEDALVVSNGAAALVLAATALAAGREIVVSRGEMVEIGDGFRLPDLLTSTGARLREVGTTNRTNLRDYREAIGPETGFVLKVHPSNFTVAGFVSAVPIADLAGLPVPVVADIGSGLLNPEPMLPDEPDASSSLSAGASLVTASGDKLLGGPQAGLVLGRRALVQSLRRHPLARALRVDKLTLAGLAATVGGPPTPTAQMLHADPESLQTRAAALAASVAASGVAADVVACDGKVGGGGAPGVSLPGWAVRLPGQYAERLRAGQPCVAARIERGQCLLDLRCVPEGDDRRLRDAILAVRPTPAED